MTVLVVLGLFFVSQLPAISNVGTTDPNKTDGERPPATDSDGDKIPDWADKNPSKAGGDEDRKPTKDQIEALVKKALKEALQKRKG